MIDERHVLALRFRELAKRFDSFSAEYPDPDAIQKYEAETDVGELIITAYRRGFLALPCLGELVEWVENAPTDPKEIEAGYSPCPSNLFQEVCGYNRWPATLRNGDPNRAELVGDATGGVVREIVSDDVLPQPKRIHSADTKRRKSLQQKALTCELLAHEIERTSGPDALDLWVYERWQNGKTQQWILTNLPDWCPDREQITTTEGIRQRFTRYAKKHKLPLRKGKRGCPPKNTN